MEWLTGEEFTRIWLTAAQMGSKVPPTPRVLGSALSEWLRFRRALDTEQGTVLPGAYTPDGFRIRRTLVDGRELFEVQLTDQEARGRIDALTRESARRTREREEEERSWSIAGAPLSEPTPKQ